jgi:quinol monooxygenase YgiN
MSYGGIAMGRITIAAFKPNPGKEQELLAVLADRLPLLRRLGLSTAREHIVMRSESGVIVEASEWVSDAAIETAHHTPEVLALWQRFDECSTYVPLQTLPEASQMFATFEAIEC